MYFAYSTIVRKRKTCFPPSNAVRKSLLLTYPPIFKEVISFALWIFISPITITGLYPSHRNIFVFLALIYCGASAVLSGRAERKRFHHKGDVPRRICTPRLSNPWWCNCVWFVGTILSTERFPQFDIVLAGFSLLSRGSYSPACAALKRFALSPVFS